jgi:ABC-2 type transport system permease protein
MLLNSAKRIAAVILRQLYLLRGSPVRVIPLVAWVAIDVLLWGFITKYLASISAVGGTLLTTLLGAVLLWDFFIRVMHGVATAFLEDVWSRNFLNLFGSPLRVSEYLAGLVVTSIVTSTLGLIVMLVIAATAFGLSYAAFGATLIPFFLVLFVFGIAMGVFGSATVLRYGPASEWFVWPLPALLSPFVGVFYPLSTLPLWMQYVAKLLPPSYVFEWMRDHVSGRHPAAGNLLWGAVLSVVSLLLACGYFSRVYRHAVRTGILARYSAESIS